MLTIMEENPASVRVIERNGGKLLQEIENLIVVHTFIENGKWRAQDIEYGGEKWFLYWIDLTHITLV
jgi:predicted acetyltransferase